MKTFSNFINGKKVPALSGKTVEIINPSTGKVYATAPDSAGPDVEMAMKAAVFSRRPRRIPVEKKNILETFI